MGQIILEIISHLMEALFENNEEYCLTTCLEVSIWCQQRLLCYRLQLTSRMIGMLYWTAGRPCWKVTIVRIMIYCCSFMAAVLELIEWPSYNVIYLFSIFQKIHPQHFQFCQQIRQTYKWQSKQNHHQKCQINYYAWQHICYSAYMPWQFRLCVRPSVTRVDQSKMIEASITQFSPYSSPIHLVFRG